LKNKSFEKSLSPRRTRVRIRGRKKRGVNLSLNGEEVRKTVYRITHNGKKSK